MNDINKKSTAFFTPSGCLTEDTLMLFVSGTLKGKDQLKAQSHITECAMCSDAADGLRMWMDENKSGHEAYELSIQVAEDKTPEFPHSPGILRPKSNKPNGFTKNLFHARTDVLNERIRQRLNTHSRLEAAEKKRLSYKPFVWLSAAATILLFIVIGYVLWLQNQLYAEKLAGERASEMLMLQGPVNPDTLTVSFPENKVAPAFTDKKGKGAGKPAQNIAGLALTEEEIIRQDNPGVASQSIEKPETTETKETSQTNAETKGSRTYRTTAAPNGKKAYTPADIMGIEEESSPVFTMVEEMPAFPGGEAARIRFLSENIIYPQQAAENGIQGTVYVSFIVNTDGKVANGKILRGIGGGCDKEALRVIKLMPNWTPGKQDGKRVDVLYTMPIVFRLVE